MSVSARISAVLAAIPREITDIAPDLWLVGSQTVDRWPNPNATYGDVDILVERAEQFDKIIEAFRENFNDGLGADEDFPEYLQSATKVEVGGVVYNVFWHPDREACVRSFDVRALRRYVTLDGKMVFLDDLEWWEEASGSAAMFSIGKPKLEFRNSAPETYMNRVKKLIGKGCTPSVATWVWFAEHGPHLLTFKD